jgi:iron complex outermembrane receptor protein
MSGPTKLLANGAGRYHLARVLLVSTAIAGVGGLQAARAQAVSSPAESVAAASLEEVLVTARKRAENLQETPVSITAISGAQVEQLNLKSFQDLRGLVPNLEVLPLATGGASMTIRGIGQTSSQVNVDAKAGLYVDDLYIARQEGNQLYFYDVEALQVLKGPQGTLFGRSSIGGAMLYEPQRPTDKFEGFVDASYGNYSMREYVAAVNVPLFPASSWSARRPTS